MANSAISVCATCAHQRKKVIANPFSGSGLLIPEILEKKAKWEQEQNNIALQEKQLFESDAPFTYEPTYLSWCACWSSKQQSEHHGLDPITGKPIRFYVLCLRANSDGKCQLYEASKQ